MRKGILIAVLLVALTTLTAAIASADAGPHGTGGTGYGTTTGACAACHRAHAAKGESLITHESIFELCVSCHSGGTGSTLDVLNGKQGTAPLAGGGFSTYKGITVTSRHSVNGSESIPIASDKAELIAYGGTLDGPGIDASQIGFECTTCHNPHGSTNYRILQDSDPGHKMPLSFTDNGILSGLDGEALPWQKNQVRSVPSGSITSQDGKTRTYVGDQNANVYGDHTWAPTAVFTGTYYTQGINDFCASCHKTYLTRHTSADVRSDSTATYASNGDTAYDRYIGMQVYVNPNQNTSTALADRFEYRHAVSRHFKRANTTDVATAIRPAEQNAAIYAGYPWRDGYAVPLRFSIDGTDPNSPISNAYGFTCLTCHFAHGTSAQTDSPYVSNPTVPFLGSKSSLLYYDNRGVCGACHQQGK